MESLISNEAAIEDLMVIGICRDNEVTYSHNVAGMLRRLEDVQGVKVTHMEIKNLSFAVANQLVAEVLSQPPEICIQLTQIIHDKTGGNVLFLLYYLEALYQEGVLVAEQLGEETNVSFQ